MPCSSLNSALSMSELTDGWAEVPELEPDVPVMWLVPLGERTEFPWGEVVPMEVE